MISVIGVDPGPTTGFCFLDYVKLPLSDVYRPQPQSMLFQADGNSARTLLEDVLRGRESYGVEITKKFAGVEKFVTGRSAGTKGSNADVTRQLVMELTETLQLFGYKVKIRPAADVKPWATDKRLIAAGIKGASGIHGKGRDSYDGSRQALHVARWDAFLPDPLA